MHTITPEMRWLVYTTLFTAFMWVPYILERLATRGLVPAITSTKAEMGETPSEWAKRALRAHVNATENLIVFATAVLIANAIGLSTTATQIAAATYFFARLIHYFVYVLGIPVIRTLAFSVAWASVLVILFSILKNI